MTKSFVNCAGSAFNQLEPICYIYKLSTYKPVLISEKNHLFEIEIAYFYGAYI